MKKVVILGAGFAGLHIFYKIRHLIGKKIEITVIDSRSHSLLKPSLPEHTLESKGATFIQDEVVKGFREYGYSVCDDTQAQRLWEKVKTFEGGKIVTGAAKSTWGTRVDAPPLSAPCEGPIGEIMFMLDYYLTQDKHISREKA